jgi:hypothetical protein
MSRLRPRNRDIWIRVLFVVLGGTFAACSSATTGDGGMCYAPSDATAVVPDCGRTTLCLPQMQDVAVTSSLCPAKTCAWTFQEDVGDTLTYDGGDNWVFLRFAPYMIAGATTTDQLVAAFQHVNFYRTFPVQGGDASLTATYFEQRTDISGFDAFELSGGMLHVRLKFMIHDPYAAIVSNAPGCSSGDVGGRCNCSYSGVQIPATIDVTLPAQIPPG